MTERVVFLLASTAAASYFAYVLARRLAAMRWAVNDLSADRFGRRLWRTFREVMLQTRVIGDRPLAGVLHALVMWGFFAFAWVSAEHMALGVIGLDHAEANTSWYGAFAAFWAVAVLIGILGLAVRRFVARPKALGELSLSSGLVAFLIAALMATYLAGWRWLEVGSGAWRINWWLHVGAFLGMFFAIPNSKHLHLVLGPFAVFFRGETISATRALREDDDEDFGMLRFGDLSRKDVLDLNSCVECGRCTEVCPAHAIGGSLDPKQVILQMQHGLLGVRNPAEATIAGTAAEVASGKAWVAEEDLYECYACGACEQACPVGIEHAGAKILDLRRGLVSEGRTHNDRLRAMFTTMERSPHNAWGASQETRRKLIEDGGFPLFDGSQQWLFWLGCGLSYDPHGRQVARAMKAILDASGDSWGVLGRETCCGEPARRAGNEYLYMELSEKVIEAFENGAVKNVISCDPHCCRAFDVDYRQNESFEKLGVRVVHHTEFLADVLPRLGLKRAAEKVTYHDPCYLARGRGVVEEPRTVLEAIGAEIAEMENSRERTFCCGAGGAQLYIADDKADDSGGRVNHRRFEQAAATGASTVAVACPYCPIMLRDAAQHAGRDEVRIVDVAELVAERL